MKVFKYPIEIKDKQIVSMPEEARILSVQIQNGQPCIWALVNEHKGNENRIIRVYGTGHPVEGNPKYISTIIDGVFVWHIFEEEQW